MKKGANKDPDPIKIADDIVVNHKEKIIEKELYEKIMKSWLELEHRTKRRINSFESTTTIVGIEYEITLKSRKVKTEPKEDTQ